MHRVPAIGRLPVEDMDVWRTNETGDTTTSSYGLPLTLGPKFDGNGGAEHHDPNHVSEGHQQNGK